MANAIIFLPSSHCVYKGKNADSFYQSMLSSIHNVKDGHITDVFRQEWFSQDIDWEDFRSNNGPIDEWDELFYAAKNNLLELVELECV